MSKMRQGRVERLARNCSVRGLSYDYPDGYLVAPHAHRTHQLLYAVAGVMTLETPVRTLVVPPQRAVWIPRGLRHSIRTSSGVAMRTLYFGVRLSPVLPHRERVFHVVPLLRELILHAIECGPLQGRRGEDHHLICTIVAQVSRAPADALELPAPIDLRAARAARAVQENPGADLTLGELARGSGASLRTIERRFRADTGMTLGRWRQQVRLISALQMLARGEAVTGVALEVGYRSVSAFIHAFRRTFGETPGRYLRLRPP
jgi:AraC-like DNA-binding protein